MNLLFFWLCPYLVIASEQLYPTAPDISQLHEVTHVVSGQHHMLAIPKEVHAAALKYFDIGNDPVNNKGKKPNESLPPSHTDTIRYEKTKKECSDAAVKFVQTKFPSAINGDKISLERFYFNICFLVSPDHVNEELVGKFMTARGPLELGKFATSYSGIPILKTFPVHPLASRVLLAQGPTLIPYFGPLETKHDLPPAIDLTKNTVQDQPLKSTILVPKDLAALTLKHFDKDFLTPPNGKEANHVPPTLNTKEYHELAEDCRKDAESKCKAGKFKEDTVKHDCEKLYFEICFLVGRKHVNTGVFSSLFGMMGGVNGAMSLEKACKIMEVSKGPITGEHPLAAKMADVTLVPLYKPSPGFLKRAGEAISSIPKVIEEKLASIYASIRKLFGKKDHQGNPVDQPLTSPVPDEKEWEMLAQVCEVKANEYCKSMSDSHHVNACLKAYREICPVVGAENMNTVDFAKLLEKMKLMTPEEINSLTLETIMQMMKEGESSLRAKTIIHQPVPHHEDILGECTKLSHEYCQSALLVSDCKFTVLEICLQAKGPSHVSSDLLKEATLKYFKQDQATASPEMKLLEECMDFARQYSNSFEDSHKADGIVAIQKYCIQHKGPSQLTDEQVRHHMETTLKITMKPDPSTKVYISTEQKCAAFAIKYCAEALPGNLASCHDAVTQQCKKHNGPDHVDASELAKLTASMFPPGHTDKAGEIAKELVKEKNATNADPHDSLEWKCTDFARHFCIPAAADKKTDCELHAAEACKCYGGPLKLTVQVMGRLAAKYLPPNSVQPCQGQKHSDSNYTVHLVHEDPKASITPPNPLIK